MWYYLYQTTGGALVSETDTQPVSLPATLSYVSFSTRQNGMVWNPATLTFSAPPNPSVISTEDFVNRFTPAEMQAIVAAEATDTNVLTHMRVLNFVQTVNLLDTVKVQPWVNYLATKGYITSARATAILTP